MGDAPGKQPIPSNPHVLSNTASDSGELPPAKKPQDSSTERYGYYGPGQPLGQSTFQGQLASQQQHSSNQPLPTQYGVQQSPIDQLNPQNRQHFMNMSSIGNALPDMSYPQNYDQYQQQPSMHRFSPSNPNPAFVYQFAGQPQPPNPPYSVPYAQHYQTMYTTPQQVMQQGPHPVDAPGHHHYTSAGFHNPQAQQLAPYPYQNQYTSQSQRFLPSFTSQSPGRSNVPIDGASLGRPRSRDQYGSTGMAGLMNMALGEPSGSMTSSSNNSQLVPRGPPRKPRQSGHALWVGNLPPGASVVDLKDHFSREATQDILSVFLISKSNCAFVNYRTDNSCAAAMTRFHDSRFQGVRLVCRLRRSTATGASNVPTGPATSSSPTTPTTLAPSGAHATEYGSATEDGTSEVSGPKDKYFIVKSLTVEDLETSARTGIWATQSHNEAALNKAFEDVESVYLIFSANKSGEYFGYARMTFPINEDPNAAIEFAPKATFVEDADLPRAIPTTATEFAPSGRIIDDSARGTIFWEAETDEVETTIEDGDNDSNHSDAEGDVGVNSKAWGKPFNIEWISTNRLPFYRTRGLRNPWNSNREVKIARDGTELETSIGRRLVAMFHRESSPVVSNMPVQFPMPASMGGYPQTRQY